MKKIAKWTNPRAEEATKQAEADLATARAHAAEVTELSAQLSDHIRENHLAEAIMASMRRRA